MGAPLIGELKPFLGRNIKGFHKFGIRIVIVIPELWSSQEEVLPHLLIAFPVLVHRFEKLIHGVFPPAAIPALEYPVLHGSKGICGIYQPRDVEPGYRKLIVLHAVLAFLNAGFKTS
ncbi:MAG: hypothetical protein DDT32_01848 [Syntrophomonadaceae bacterium]|nr:hypothetical protein [Bacillota bacterium]MBT9148078.1 hypothetical protein [Bacillota bacterium]